ncbi:hypothetical protein VNO77_06946 [Canavalia gladiata]|uniref:Uncharacterized protein n=1 Tax=Canavalia gladiata TaxID=3824 RepID=A0AAN9MCU4_CANGL
MDLCRIQHDKKKNQHFLKQTVVFFFFLSQLLCSPFAAVRRSPSQQPPSQSRAVGRCSSYQFPKVSTKAEVWTFACCNNGVQIVEGLSKKV